MRCRRAPTGTAEGICYRTPQRSRAGTSWRQKRFAAAPCLTSCRVFWSLGMLPSDGNGRRYWPPRPTQRPCGDFFVTGEMPSDGRRAA